MKRTILATAIALTSFGAMANGSEKPPTTEQKVAAFNAVMVKAGNEANIVKNDNGKYEITFTEHGETQTIELTARDAEAMKQRMHKQAADNLMSGESKAVAHIKTIADENNHERIKQYLRDNTDGTHMEEFIRNYVADSNGERIKQEVREKFQDLENQERYQLADNIADKARTTVIDYKNNKDLGEIFHTQVEKAGYKVEVEGAYLVFTPEGTEVSDPILIEKDKFIDTYNEKVEEARLASEERDANRERNKNGDAVVEPQLPEKATQVREALTELANNLGDSGQNLTDSGKAAAQQAAVQQNQIDELYALGNQNASDIDTLFSEVDRLDTRIDQTQALNAATVNARPMVANGMTAFGAGVGYAGSEAALAIGVAHSFVDTGWSASGTLAASSDDVVVGGGVQYAF